MTYDNTSGGNASVENVTIYQTRLKAYFCPSDDSDRTFNDLAWVTITNLGASYTGAATNYVASWGDMKTGNPTFDQYAGEQGGPNWGCNATFRGMFGDCSNGAVRSIRDVTDGTSNTLLVGENSPNYNGSLLWTNGNAVYASTVIPLNWKTNLKDNQVDVDGTTCGLNQLNALQCPHCYRNQTYNYGFKSKHPGGANFAMTDGSVRYLKQTINPLVFNALGSRAGGEVLSSDQY